MPRNVSCLVFIGEDYYYNDVYLYISNCRSILTVPWIELGGECSISCSKTGYNASIVFHTKPFYGGKKHRVTADIL